MNLKDLIVLYPLIFLAGFVDSIAGGGGLISLPAYLFIGLPSHNALATNKLSSTIGTIFSTLRYAKGRAIVYVVAVPSVIGSLIGSHIGARLALVLSDSVLKVILAFLIPFAAVVVLLANPKRSATYEVENISKIRTILISGLIGLTIGMYDGFFGPGTGTFLIILYVSVLSLDHISASGTAKIVNLASNVGALLTFIVGGKVMYAIGLPAALFGIAGNWIGSGLALKKGAKIIKPVMIVVLIILFTKVLMDLV
ncbi:TSUP family transporter [Fervidobacterium islandicum]|uniref:Probable membrane transporter protein n=1 Tax=Fervidobacterium islandicum TaxID=2423 RepID=A0AAI8CLN1_FERIS|nr:TSUP family transporter [Fervidobacterium islandicum]AMW32894.1 TSUP family transporter [Fervidobacterium islandicum]